MNIEIIQADYLNQKQAKDIIVLMNAYARDLQKIVFNEWGKP